MRFSQIAHLFKTSPLPWAICVFLAANFLFFAWNPFGNVDPDALPVARNWVWWAAHEFMDAKKAPDVVVIGSSVVMHPLWHHEADFRQKPVDLVADHRSYFLEDVIARNTGRKSVRCFNFGLPGSMVSDDYMVVRALFKPEKKPNLVIIGLCPRDMVDNRFNCAGSSKHFQYLSRFADVRNLIDLSMPQWWQRISYLASESIYFSSKAKDSQVVLSEKVKALASLLNGRLPESPLDRKTEEDKRFAMYQNLVEKGFWIAKPNAPFIFMPDNGDLKRRYSHANNPLFNNQKKWLELCLEACWERGIKVVLVNMPNTKFARVGMPAGVYERHVACLKELSKKWDCQFVDVNLPDYYEQKDFTDNFHLSAQGGGKAFELIGKAMGTDLNTVASLTGSSTRQIAAGRGSSM